MGGDCSKIFGNDINLSENSQLNNVADAQHTKVMNKIVSVQTARGNKITYVSPEPKIGTNGKMTSEIKYTNIKTGNSVLLKIETKGRLSKETYTTASGRTYLKDYPNANVAHTKVKKYVNGEYKGMSEAGRTQQENYFEPKTGNAPATEIRKIEPDTPVGSGNGVSAHISEI
ncbi:MAG: hypothetical protein CVT89_02595 [Candidatus Altiarchaeales archaeon HGW-Altiarchaeales-2]|nr:MAG: hypothetical protein CVT89_02595 [Candidatus Altiarchaeales archaeon HGW-Altiarchaeales-2]